MNLNVDRWGEFRIGKLFYKLENGKANDGMLDEGVERIYLGAKKNDNGVMRHCASNLELEQEGNCIIFICNGQGSVGYANYMNDTFIGTTDIVAGYCNNMNEYIGEFMATVFCLERPKYSFGRKWKTHLGDTIVKLPIQHNSDGSPYIDPECKYSEKGYVPDWQLMEDYIKSLHHKPLTTKNTVGNALALKLDEWKEFRFGNLISRPYKAKAFNKDDLEVTEKKGLRYITRTGINNGCEMIVNALTIPQQYIEKGNAISIGDTTATCFYQEEDFITGDHMVVVRAEWMNKFNGLFIVSILQNEQYKYSYGRAFLIERIEETMMNLPIQHNPDGTPYIDSECKYSEEGYVPDWQFMEDYIRSLPYGDRL